MTKIELAVRQAIHKINKATALNEESDELLMEAVASLREALDHIAASGNKVSDHIADSGKLINKFIPVGIVNDHHSITWMEEIVDDQAPIGAILYALQDSVGRNVSFASEAVCNWHQDDDDGTWATDCGGVFVIIEGAPSDNEMKFCAYCGKPIKEHLFVDSEDGQ